MPTVNTQQQHPRTLLHHDAVMTEAEAATVQDEDDDDDWEDSDCLIPLLGQEGGVPTTTPPPLPPSGCSSVTSVVTGSGRSAIHALRGQQQSTTTNPPPPPSSCAATGGQKEGDNEEDELVKSLPEFSCLEDSPEASHPSTPGTRSTSQAISATMNLSAGDNSMSMSRSFRSVARRSAVSAPLSDLLHHSIGGTGIHGPPKLQVTQWPRNRSPGASVGDSPLMNARPSPSSPAPSVWTELGLANSFVESLGGEKEARSHVEYIEATTGSKFGCTDTRKTWYRPGLLFPFREDVHEPMQRMFRSIEKKERNATEAKAREVGNTIPCEEAVRRMETLLREATRYHTSKASTLLQKKLHRQMASKYGIGMNPRLHSTKTATRHKEAQRKAQAEAQSLYFEQQQQHLLRDQVNEWSVRSTGSYSSTVTTTDNTPGLSTTTDISPSSLLVEDHGSSFSSINERGLQEEVPPVVASSTTLGPHYHPRSPQTPRQDISDVQRGSPSPRKSLNSSLLPPLGSSPRRKVSILIPPRDIPPHLLVKDDPMSPLPDPILFQALSEVLLLDLRILFSKDPAQGFTLSRKFFGEVRLWEV